MPSGRVELPQVGAMAVSERVALRLPLPGVVVTCLSLASDEPGPPTGNSAARRVQ
jgi:hypothetical protein